MIDFWKDLLVFGFLQNAFWAVLLAAPAAGVVGSWVHLKRLGSMAGAMAHASLGGMGLVVFCNGKFDLALNPMMGGVLTSLFGALVLTILKKKGNQKEESILNALWSVGMASGLIFLALSPGYQTDLDSWLFGNLLMVETKDLLLLGILDVLVLGFCLKNYWVLESSSFDEEFTALRGVNTLALYFGLLVATGLTIILLIQMVGIILVIALLSLPTAVLATRVLSLKQLMIGSSILCALMSLLGLNVSYAWDLPSGPVIVLIAGLVYGLQFIFSNTKGKQ